MIVVIWILLKWDFGTGGHLYFWFMVAAAVCTGVSGLLYVYDGIKQLGAHPASSAIEK
jgi:hypothetical protein